MQLCQIEAQKVNKIYKSKITIKSIILLILVVFSKNKVILIDWINDSVRNSDKIYKETPEVRIFV